MCITLDEWRNGGLNWVWCLCISLCIICVKIRHLCTVMHRLNLCTHFMHDFCRSYAQGLYLSVTYSCTIFDYLTLDF